MLIKSLFNLRGDYSKEQEVGIEVEMEGQRLNFSPMYWARTDDGSLRSNVPNGTAEFVMLQPCRRTEVANVINDLIDSGRRARAVFSPSERCGVHVHLNCLHMHEYEVLKLAVLFLLFEEVMVGWCGPTREGNHFCLRGKDATGLLNAISHAISIRSLSNIQADRFRYAAINLRSLSRHGTVEFRSMQTPNDLHQIEQWVSMILAIKDTALSINSISGFIAGIKYLSVAEALSAVFGEAAIYLLPYANDQVLKNGIFNTQCLALQLDKWAQPIPVRSQQVAVTARPTFNDTRRTFEAAWRAAVVEPVMRVIPEGHEQEEDDV